MVRDRQAKLVRLVRHGLHEIAVNPADLYAVGAERLERLHVRARVGGGLHLGAVLGPELRVHEDARSNDLAARGLVSQVDAALVGLSPDFAYRGDAVGELKLHVVVESAHGLSRAIALHVRVVVDQARQDEFPGGIDLHITGRSTGITTAHGNGVKRHDFRDGVADDHDVDGAAGGCTVAVHHGGVADHEACGAHTVDDGGLCGQQRRRHRKSGNGVEGTKEIHRGTPVGGNRWAS